MKPDISLVPWTTRRSEVMAIEIQEAQKAYLGEPSVADFLASDDEHPTFSSYAVCDGEFVVGLVCYGHEVGHEPWRRWIPLIVIDHRFQGRGFGRKTMEEVISRVRREATPCRAIGLSCKPQNEIAMRLYRSLGFQHTRVNSRGGVDMWLSLDK
jgi:diamine N-acetyltransferase